MKVFFISSLMVLVLMSVVAWRIQPAVVKDGKVTLVWVSDDNPARRGQVDLFNKLNRGYHLVLDPDNATTEKVIVQSLGGVGPDLLDCDWPPSLLAYVKSGIALDLTDELRRAGIDLKKETWNVGIENYSYNGRVYGFPTNFGVDGLWYNKDLFDKAGLPYPRGPWRWKDIIPLAQRLTIRDKSGRVKQFGLLCDWSRWSLFVIQWGGRVYSEDGSRCLLDSPQAIAGVQFLHDLVYKYRVCPDPAEEQAVTQGGWGSGIISWFGSGRGAMAVGGRWWLCMLRQYDGLRLGAVEAPHGPRRVFIGGAKATLINKNSPRRREAMAFLTYLRGKEYNELVNHQADAMGPVIRYCYTRKFLHDPEYPKEDYNAVWRDLLKLAVPHPETSPFVKGDVATRIIWTQLDLIRNNEKSVAEGMRTAARQVNEEIQRGIERDRNVVR